jgi:hypothetical protein
MSHAHSIAYALDMPKLQEAAETGDVEAFLAAFWSQQTATDTKKPADSEQSRAS